MPKLKKSITTIFKIAFASGLIWYLISSGSLNIQSMGKALTHTFWFSLVTLLMGMLVFITSYRWYLLLLAQGVTISFWKTLSLNFIGMFFNICLPGSTGGDLAKCYYVASIYPDKKASTITTVLIDRILGLTGLILVGGIAVLAYPSISLGGSRILRAFSSTIIIFGLGTVASLIILLNIPVSFMETYLEKSSHLPLRNLLLKFYQALRVYRNKQSVIYFAIFLSTLVHTTIVISSFLIGKIIGSAINWRCYGVITPMGLLAGALPIAPAGLGVGEAAFEYLYQQVNSPIGGEIMALLHMVSIFWGLVGLPFYLLTKKSPLPSTGQICSKKSFSNEW
ncbi:MAG: lysylphosphatidylglycerol synthase transmembrane domain-containing protein [bacterium]